MDGDNIMSKGFYKIIDENLYYAENSVYNKDYELHVSSYQDHTYPIDGWYYFETIEEAASFLGYTLPEEENSAI